MIENTYRWLRFTLLSLRRKRKKNPLLKPPIHPDLELLLILLLNLNLKAVGSRPGLFKHLTPELTTKTNNNKKTFSSLCLIKSLFFSQSLLTLRLFFLSIIISCITKDTVALWQHQEMLTGFLTYISNILFRDTAFLQFYCYVWSGFGFFEVVLCQLVNHVYSQ